MTEPLPISSKAGYALELTVFACGALVMIYEIIGSRIVSPFIGTSTYVWTSLIGVILAALSLGYWLGGRLADRRPDIRILASVIFLAGGGVSVTILFKDIVLSFIAAGNVGLEIKSVIAAILLFAPASILLGFVTPFAVKLKTLSLDDTGKMVGRIYALSTIGSIVGTFAAGFILIPFAGSTRTLYLIAGTLFFLSLLLAPFAISRANTAIITIFAFGIGANELSALYLRQSTGLHDIDTEYSRVQVFQTVEPKSGRKIQVLKIDPFFVQSAVYLDGNEIVFDYIRYYHLVKHFKPDHTRSLMIGGAGYTFPRDFLAKYGESRIDVVEIDPKMTDIATRFFRLESDPRMTIVHQDGRVFLNHADSEKYDAVFMDAFGSLFSVPYQLTTVEAVRHISRILKDDGVVIFNLGSAITGEGSRFLQAEFATYKAIFPNVYLFKVNSDYTDESLQNLVIVASKSTDKISLNNSDPDLAHLLSHIYSKEIPAGLPILTDDLAPVEHYNSIAQNLTNQ
ncbi:MAG: fused MFS/spermidine synthase [Saprospiraceae bacterium]|nr:fused MFS/spermidine synthase [Pyrinomonadaceae bacterium]